MTALHIGWLDSGIDEEHPELRGKVAARCHIDDTGTAHPGSPCADESGHGTGTTALCVGNTLGLAPFARLHLAKVIEGGEVCLRIASGLQWLLQQPIDLVCLPLGLTGNTPIYLPLIDEFTRRGIPVVAPIGNSGPGRVHSPGWYPDVLSAGTCTADGCASPFSGSLVSGEPRRCLKPDWLLESVGMRTAAPGGGVQTVSGTSYACARLAGIIARLMQAAGPMAPAQLRARLARVSRAPTDAPGGTRRSRYGLLTEATAAEAAKRDDLAAAYDRPENTLAKHIDRHLLHQVEWSDGPHRLLMTTRNLDAEVLIKAVRIARPGQGGVEAELLGPRFVLATADNAMLDDLIAHPEVTALQATTQAAFAMASLRPATSHSAPGQRGNA